MLQIPGVLALVSRDLEPEPVTDFKIESLRSALFVHRMEPHPYLLIGNRVRINRGPLMGMEGVLVRKKYPIRVAFSLDLFIRSMALEISADALAPAYAVPATGRASKVQTMCALGDANG